MVEMSTDQNQAGPDSRLVCRHRNSSRGLLCNSRRVTGRPGFAWVFFLVASVCAHPACRPDDDAAGNDAGNVGTAKRPADLLVFPDALRVADPSVNAFVERAMTSCGSGDYDSFRLLWSVREDPLPRGEYEQGWKAVQRIHIRALEEMALAPNLKLGRDDYETSYIILASILLDPSLRAGQQEPNREVVLQLVREQDAWRLARASKAMRLWVKESGAGREDASSVSVEKQSEHDAGRFEPTRKSSSPGEGG